MITDILLENFQGHIETHLELHHGVNVIKGTSHHGKTSIARGIEWNVLNDPPGDIFGTWLKKKGTPYSCTIQTSEEEYVIRERGSKFNGYRIKDDNLEALGQKVVPQEIKNILGLNEVNIQSQENNHFLISDKPPEVARKLNEIAGLEIIHKVLAKVESILRDSRKGARLLEGQIEREEKNLEQYRFLNKTEPLIKNIEVLLQEQNQAKTKIKALREILSNMTGLKEELELHQSIITVREPCNALKIKIERSEKLQSKITDLKAILNNIVSLKEELENCEIFMEIKPQVNSLKINLDKHQSICARINELKKVLSSIENLKKTQSELNVRAEQARIERSTILKSYKICPFCKKPM